VNLFTPAALASRARRTVLRRIGSGMRQRHAAAPLPATPPLYQRFPATIERVRYHHALNVVECDSERVGTQRFRPKYPFRFPLFPASQTGFPVLHGP